MLSVAFFIIVLNAIMLSVVMLCVVAPFVYGRTFVLSLMFESKGISYKSEHLLGAPI